MSGHLEALVFDFDGLIVDTETPQFDTVARAFDDHDVELLLDDWREIIGTSDHPHWSEMLADALGPERSASVDFAALRRAKLTAYWALLEDTVPLPGVADLIDEAVATGLGLAVASSSPLEWVDGHLHRTGIRHHFSSVHARDHVEKTKPAPDLFVLAGEALGVDPARTVVLEDSPHGVTAAKAAGMHAVACPNPITSGGDFTHADLVVESLADVSLDRLRYLVNPDRSST